jgi:Ca2+-binding RTX toxin-like protein
VANLTYAAFLNALGQRESGGNYAAVNGLGYLGKYQFGELALRDLGYYTYDGTSRNDWLPAYWTGKNGIHSEGQFLASHAVQESAIREYMVLQWHYIQKAWAYDGQVLAGVKITVSGMLAGAHLVGAGNLTHKYLLSGGDVAPADGNHVSVTSYVKLFAGYLTPFVVNHNVGESIAGGSGNDILNGRGGNDIIAGRGGHDIIAGWTGKDQLFGGAGADTFYFSALNQSPAGANRDVIRDFTHWAGDKIDLHVIDADTHLAGNQAFKFIGAHAFHKVDGELRYAHHILQADVNGDGHADFEILINAAKLVAMDFFL